MLVDNYDSFTYNLYQMLAQVNESEPVVVKNDSPAWRDIDLGLFDNVVISPGPGTPLRSEDIGIGAQLICEAELPVLGVCLGHQALCHIYGARVQHAPEAVHGRTSVVSHNGDALFAGIPSSFEAVRYHSLAVTELPDELEPLAYADDGVLMAVRHRSRPLWGVQYHPESISTDYGLHLLENFRDLSRQWNKTHRPASMTRQVRWSLIEGWTDPADVFVHNFAQSETAFWLDSAQVVPGLSQFSYMGDASGPLSEVIRYNLGDCEQSIFSVLDREIAKKRVENNDLPFDFNLGYVGYLGYELKAECGGTAKHHSDLPDAMFVFADRMVVFDHAQRNIYLVALDDGNSTGEWLEQLQVSIGSSPKADHISAGKVVGDESLAMRHSRDEYLTLIDECKQRIRDGESYEICLTNELSGAALVDPLQTYLALRTENPAPFASYFRFPECSISSASPERFLRVDKHGFVEAKPVKGTTRRGATYEEDELLRESLRRNEKDLAENLMIVDLLRNDLGSVCEVGSVEVPKLYEVETYATVHQLVSTVTGRLSDGYSAMDCVRAAFPGGSMTGAPKIRTMQILDELESGPRGIYSGAIGYLALSGAADWSIVIRTIVNTDDRLTIGVGGAITALSDPTAEFDETLLKAKALRKAAFRADYAS